MTLLSAAATFFAGLEQHPAAAEPVRRYPLDLQLVSPGESVIVRLREGRLAEVAAGAEPTGYWTLELRADAALFDELLGGEVSLGEACYSARLVVPEEKSKHNLVCALGQSIRLLQEAGGRRRPVPSPAGGASS